MNRIIRSVLLFLCSLLLAGTAASQTGTPLSLEAIADAFGISESDLADLRQGKRVGGDLSLVSENELGLSLGVRVSRTPDEIWEYLIGGRFMEEEPTIRQYGVIGEDVAASFAKLELPDAEIERLANVEPGPDINLSMSEIESLQKIAASTTEPTARREALLEDFRRILVGRVEAYQKGGFEAIAPYARGDGEVGAPAVELGHALGEMQATKKLSPRIFNAFAQYPSASSKGIERRFYWTVNGADEHVLVSLVHRVQGREGDHIFEYDHRFYVNHTVNSMQAVSVIIPVENGSIVIYANRTYTDLVAGFLGRVARGIGRTLMRSEIYAIVDIWEEAVEKP
jgi:hypothetical protein